MPANKRVEFINMGVASFVADFHVPIFGTAFWLCKRRREGKSSAGDMDAGHADRDEAITQMRSAGLLQHDHHGHSDRQLRRQWRLNEQPAPELN
jgi:hypothetical protein